jgi:uncharacterized membrane protein YfcA
MNATVLDYTSTDLAIALMGAFSLGVSKSGFPGLAIVNVIIMAHLFGARESVGIILPLLIASDVIVWPMFRHLATWEQVRPLLLPTAIGIVAGVWLLARIDNATAKPIIGCIILTMVALQLIREYRRGFLEKLPDAKPFLWATGGGIGVATMLANAAGPVYSIYALVHRMKKEEFLGIGARFFILLNAVKFPILAFGIPGVGKLALITPQSLLLDLKLLPGVICGILLGRKIIRHVPQRVFEWLLYGFSLIAGIKMLVG